MPDRVSKVSVVVPAYNAASTIEETLRSISAQTSPPAEVIIIDDGSRDGTASIAEALANDMGDISLTVVQQQNAGAGAARNRGIETAQGDVIAFLDADDTWLPKKLEASVDLLNRNSLTLVAHDFLQISENGEETHIACTKLYKQFQDTPFHGLYRKGFIGTSTVVARRDALLAAGGFDDTLFAAQDFDLWLKIVGNPDTAFEIFATPLTRYQKNPLGITSQIEKRLRSTWRVAVRHAPTLHAHPGSALGSRLFRVLAIHFEAFNAYRSQDRVFAAFWTALRCPLKLLRIIMV